MVDSVTDRFSKKQGGIAYFGEDDSWAVVIRGTNEQSVSILPHELGHLVGDLKDLDDGSSDAELHNLMYHTENPPQRAFRLEESFQNQNGTKGQVEASRTSLPARYWK